MNEVLSLRGGCYDVLGGLPGDSAAILPPGAGSLPETSHHRERQSQEMERGKGTLMSSESLDMAMPRGIFLLDFLVTRENVFLFCLSQFEVGFCHLYP